jgi:hypothetical protein
LSALPPLVLTDPTITAHVSKPRVQHIQELRDALK